MADTTIETIQEETMTPDQLRDKLEEFKASATKEYSLKNYSAAAENYSEAAAIQDELNGEMSVDNGDLLYQYGRCLYHVAVSNSDVLGGKVASAEEPQRKKRKVAGSSKEGAVNGDGVIGDALKDSEQKMAEDVVEPTMDEKDGLKAEPEGANRPYFQITGDENWTDSEEEGDEQADAQADEEEDDFAIAYEILDVARVLLGRKLTALQENAGKGSTENSEARQIKERLADTHDLQAEISLENERFADAINDTRESLNLKIELYPEESSLIAEAHFKLSLALEFASVTSTSDGTEPEAEAKEQNVDESMREEAAVEMEKAISSCKLRISKEESSLPTLEGAKAEERKRSIADVKDMVKDMETRLIDLRKPPVSLSAITGPAGGPDGSDALGILGSLLGESKGEQQKRLQEATAQANDLSGLVKHKKKAKVDSEAVNGGAVGAANDVAEGKGKRKAEEVVDGEAGTDWKKAKVEDH